eukprot:3629191-Karenia_brevis.AAC.1
MESPTSKARKEPGVLHRHESHFVGQHCSKNASQFFGIACLPRCCQFLFDHTMWWIQVQKH